MSENAEVVRKPWRVRERSRRTLDERSGIRFPKVPRLTSRLVSRLPPSSQLRQAALWREFRRNAEAFNRRDLEAVLLNDHPDFEFCPPRQLADSGIADPSYRGRDGSLRFMSGWFSAWGDFRFGPKEAIDLGDRGVVVGKLAGRAA
jgi:hypothetical protein